MFPGRDSGAKNVWGVGKEDRSFIENKSFFEMEDNGFDFCSFSLIEFSGICCFSFFAFSSSSLFGFSIFSIFEFLIFKS